MMSRIGTRAAVDTPICWYRPRTAVANTLMANTNRQQATICIQHCWSAMHVGCQLNKAACGCCSKHTVLATWYARMDMHELNPMQLGMQAHSFYTSCTHCKLLHKQAAYAEELHALQLVAFWSHIAPWILSSLYTNILLLKPFTSMHSYAVAYSAWPQGESGCISSAISVKAKTDWSERQEAKAIEHHFGPDWGVMYLFAVLPMAEGL